MTKLHFKQIIGGLLGIALLAPSVVFAQGTTPAEKPTRLQFCGTIDGLATKVEGGIAEREARFQANRAELRTKLDERLTARSADLVDHRTDWDTSHAEWYAKLRAKASTTDQKAAVEKFVTAIDTAIAARRAAVDSAINDYRSALNSAVVVRQASSDALIATFRTETSAALAKAKADCAAGIVPKTARETYTAAMKAAREKLRTGIKDHESRKDTLQPVLDARKSAIAKAVTDFKAAVAKATYDLKQNVKS